MTQMCLFHFPEMGGHPARIRLYGLSPAGKGSRTLDSAMLPKTCLPLSRTPSRIVMDSSSCLTAKCSLTGFFSAVLPPS